MCQACNFEKKHGRPLNNPSAGWMDDDTIEEIDEEYLLMRKKHPGKTADEILHIAIDRVISLEPEDIPAYAESYKHAKAKQLDNNPQDLLPGGKADGMTIPMIAHRHKVSLGKLASEYDKGVKIEMEHTKNRRIAEEIARDHLFEFPDYYTRLIRMEKQAKKNPASEPKTKYEGVSATGDEPNGGIVDFAKDAAYWIDLFKSKSVPGANKIKFIQGIDVLAPEPGRNIYGSAFIKSGGIAISMHDVHGEELPYETVIKTILHEIGHFRYREIKTDVCEEKWCDDFASKWYNKITAKSNPANHSSCPNCAGEVQHLGRATTNPPSSLFEIFKCSKCDRYYKKVGENE